MATRLDIVVAAYPDQERADTILDALQKMHRACATLAGDDGRATHPARDDNGA